MQWLINVAFGIVILGIVCVVLLAALAIASAIRWMRRIYTR